MVGRLPECEKLSSAPRPTDPRVLTEECRLCVLLIGLSISWPPSSNFQESSLFLSLLLFSATGRCGSPWLPLFLEVVVVAGSPTKGSSCGTATGFLMLWLLLV